MPSEHLLRFFRPLQNSVKCKVSAWFRGCVPAMLQNHQETCRGVENREITSKITRLLILHTCTAFKDTFECTFSLFRDFQFKAIFSSWKRLSELKNFNKSESMPKFTKDQSLSELSVLHNAHVCTAHIVNYIFALIVILFTAQPMKMVHKKGKC